MLDFQNLTIGDLMVLEDHGVSLDDMTPDTLEGTPLVKVIAAARFLQLRATNPSATWEDALGSKFTDLQEMAGEASPES